MTYRSFLPLFLFAGLHTFGQQSNNPTPPSKSQVKAPAQSTANTSAEDEQEDAPTVRTIDLSDGKPLTGLPNSPIVGYPALCSSDGTTFLEFYNTSAQSSGVVAGQLFSISESGEIKKIHRNLPVQNKATIYVLSTYPGEDAIATLFSVIPQTSQKDGERDNSPQYYISLSKRNGEFSKQLPLSLRFEPLKVAVLESGRFLMLGIEPLNHQPMLALLDTDGTYLRSLDLDPRPIAGSESLQALYKNPVKRSGSLDASAAPARDAVFTPYGNKVLFFQPGSDLPVRILGEDGEENAVHVSLPKNYLLEYVLPSSTSDTWVIRSQRLGDFMMLRSKGIATNPKQQLFEVDPLTGNVLHALQISGTQPGEISCAADKKLSAPRYLSRGDVKDTDKSAGWYLASQDR